MSDARKEVALRDMVAVAVQEKLPDDVPDADAEISVDECVQKGRCNVCNVRGKVNVKIVTSYKKHAKSVYSEHRLGSGCRLARIRIKGFL